MKPNNKKRIALVCSAGGHLNQIKELLPFFEDDHRLALVTLDRVDAKLTIPKNVSLLFINDIRGIRNNLRNLTDSVKVFFRVFPHVIITTGAGAAYITCLLGKLFLRKVIFIESFARIDGPSSFGRKIHRLANKTLYQWPGLGKYYPSGIFAGPIFNFSFESEKRNSNLVFITVGSTEFQFNRLLTMADRLADDLSEDVQVIAQGGMCDYSPRSIKVRQWISVDEMKEYFIKSRVVITHAGTGSIINALNCGAKVIVVPRLADHKEHIDNHQIEIAKEFQALGYVAIANDLKELKELYDNLDNYVFKGELSNERMKDIIISNI